MCLWALFLYQSFISYLWWEAQYGSCEALFTFTNQSSCFSHFLRGNEFFCGLDDIIGTHAICGICETNNNLYKWRALRMKGLASVDLYVFSSTALVVPALNFFILSLLQIPLSCLGSILRHHRRNSPTKAILKGRQHNYYLPYYLILKLWMGEMLKIQTIQKFGVLNW